MVQIPTLKPTELVQDRPFTDPDRIVNDINTLRFMVDQLCLYLENDHLYANRPPPIIVHQPSRGEWFYRLVIPRPEILLQPGELVFVGFLGHRREDANLELAGEFDEILLNEIPDYPGLLSYSTMPLVSGDYSNLVIFTDTRVKEQWSQSMAHQQAVRKLSPDYYKSIKLYNGKLPGGIVDSGALQLSRIKYFDYQVAPLWQAVRVFPKGS